MTLAQRALAAITTFAMLAGAAVMFTPPQTATAALLGDNGDNSLVDLFVLEELFNNEDGNGGLFGGDGGLGDLIILDQVLGDDGDGGVLNGSDGDSDLTDLFILQELFNGENGSGILNGGNGDSDITDLIILQELFGNDGDGLLNGGDGDNNLTDLFILEELFNNGDGGLFNGDDNGNANNAGARQVTVQSGDTLSGLALRFYGDASRFPVIADANDIENPNLIFPGQRLTIPDLN